MTMIPIIDPNRIPKPEVPKLDEVAFKVTKFADREEWDWMRLDGAGNVVGICVKRFPDFAACIENFNLQSRPYKPTVTVEIGRE